MRSWVIALALAAGCGACATLQRGTVASTYPNGLTRVYLGSADGLSAGSPVSFYEDTCLDDLETGYPYIGNFCKNTKVGDGLVTQVLSPHEALVAVQDGGRVRSGVIVKPAAPKLAH